ncbi:MAG: GGDEF domain-containing protein [Flexilinea sp.]
MGEYDTLSKEKLIEKIIELQILLEAIKAEKNSQELLDFPWVGNLGNWYWYLKSNRVICNDQKILALGYCKEEIPENIGFEFFTEKLHPDDYEPVMENMRNHLYGKSPAYETTYRIKTKDNNWIWFYDRGKITRRNEFGKPELVTGIVFDITEQKRMEELLEQQNRQLLELSNTDYLTNIYNRRALFEKLDYEIRRAERSKNPLSILILDIDHFKQINDTYGHLVGDKILTRMAKHIKKMVRDTDIVGRYGGEEFLVIFPECSKDEGFKIAEKIRLSIRDSEFESNIKITISGGIAEYKGQTIDSLIESADNYLYKAKEKGRNQILFPSIP